MTGKEGEEEEEEEDWCHCSKEGGGATIMSVRRWGTLHHPGLEEPLQL